MNIVYILIYFTLYNYYILILIEHDERIYGEFSIEKNTPLSFIFSNTSFIGTHNQKDLYLYFVLPEDQSLINGEDFLNRFKNDPNIVQAIKSFKNHNIHFLPLHTEEELEEINNKDKLDNILAGIVFNKDYTDYTIRIKYYDIVDSRETPVMDFGTSRKSEYVNKYKEITRFDGKDFYSYLERNEVDDYNNYKKFGQVILYYKGNTVADLYKDTFIPIQMAIDNIVIQQITNGTIKGYTANVGKLSKPEVNYMLDDEQNYRLSFNDDSSIPYILFIGPVIHLILKLMYEKKSGIKDGLISNGVNRILIWLTWIVIYIPFIVISIASVLCIEPRGLTNSINILLFFIILFLYGITVLEIIVILCLLTNNGKFIVFIIALAVIFTDILIYNLSTMKIEGNEKTEKIISFIYSPFSIYMIIDIILFENNRGGYISFSDIFKSEIGIYLLLIFMDIFFYFAIAVFIDYYSFDWKIKLYKLRFLKEKDDNMSHALDIQEDPLDSECYVQVRNVYKYFKFRKNYISDDNNNDGKMGKIFNVNKNINFNVYKNEIFSILGHNGAGKSTLIKIMTGLLKPEKGEIYYNGLPLSHNKKVVQYHFGICPEKNILINNFTVAEHYILYSRIKEKYDELDVWLKDIELYEKRDCMVRHLSIGQRRKLCIGLAFIGDPKYVFLDEPTTGLDPLSRQKIWKLLMRKKRNRVIFITTHDMDEADIIADRKLILNKGSIRCLGSSVYLKKHFQMRYNLEIETNKPQDVEGIVKYYIPDAEYCLDKSSILDNKLPSNTFSIHIWKLAIDSSLLFSYLIKHLEEEKQKGDILNNFSVSAPRLEELFIQLDQENELLKRNEIKPSNSNEPTDALIESRSINVKDDIVELPKRELIKKHNDFITSLYIAVYRFKSNFRSILFIGITIILPFFIEMSTFGSLMQLFLPSEPYEKLEISSEMYSDQRWNYDKSHSQSILNTITPEMLKEGPTGLTNLEYQNSDVLNLDIINKNKADLFAHDPYYVSSFYGELNNDIYNFSIYYNDSMPHSLPSLLNSLSNAIIHSNAPNANTTIQVNLYPLSQLDLNIYVRTQIYFLMNNFCICIAFILFFCGSNVVKERMNKLLKQFQLNGVSNFSYWFSLFINDYIWYIISILGIILPIIILNYIPLNYLSILILLIFHLSLCGISCILFQYVLSFIFTNENAAVMGIFCLNFLSNFIIIRAFKEISFEKQFSIKFLIEIIIMDILLPCYGFLCVIRDCLTVGIKYVLFKEDDDVTWKNILLNQPYINISHVVGTVIGIALYILILKIIIKKKYTDNKKDFYEISEEMEDRLEKEMKSQDEDVYYEYRRVKEDIHSNTIPVKMIHLIKEYDDLKFTSLDEFKEALHRTTQAKYGEYHLSVIEKKEKHRIVKTGFENINLGISKCECFGLLGPNGSGKTSLLNALSLTFNPTAGDIIYEGKNINDYKSDKITIGYCPQENTLWEGMSVHEHIEMFLFIRGCSRKESKRIANQFIDYCRLTPHKNKYPSELSGGTRRKLNVLMALCCDSSRILLDEPSTGMDPVSRHYIWNIIKSTIQQNQSSAIMTTHSMEEAELFCNRIGIIVNGKLQCIGTPEHLRMKYGHTYILDVHTENIERFHKEVVVEFNLFGSEQTYKREDVSQYRVKYEIQHTNTSDISRVFEIMEACRDIYVDGQYLYIDYNYSQTTLEEIFINFARLQENSEDKKDIDDLIIK